MRAQVVSFHCVMKNIVGTVLNSTFSHEMLNYAPPGADIELPGLTAALQSVRKGERRHIKLPAAEAYGLYDPGLLAEVSRRSLTGAGGIAPGDRLHLAGPDGVFRLYRVTNVRGEMVSLDANHPLAGQDLIFEVHVTEARDATASEVAEACRPESASYLH